MFSFSFKIIGKNTHIEQIETRLNFIDNINAYLTKKFELNFDHIKKLWTIIIKNGKTDVEKSIFLEFLNKGKESNYAQRKKYFLNETLMKNVFNHLIAEKTLENYLNISLNLYNCIRTMFETVNVREGNIEMMNANYLKIIRWESIAGIKVFWSILAKSNNLTVLRICKDYLNSLHLQLTNSEKTINCLKLFKKAVEFMNDGSINSTNIIIFIHLLKDLVNE